MLKEGICIIDGSVAGNPGKGGIGVVLMEKGNEGTVFRVSKSIGWATNNEAEWLAFIEALRLAKRKGFQKLQLLTDSELLLRQWNGTYKVKAKNLQKLFNKAKELANTFQDLQIIAGSRKDTKEAHKLANMAVREVNRNEFGKKGNKPTTPNP